MPFYTYLMPSDPPAGVYRPKYPCYDFFTPLTDSRPHVSSPSSVLFPLLSSALLVVKRCLYVATALGAELAAAAPLCGRTVVPRLCAAYDALPPLLRTRDDVTRARCASSVVPRLRPCSLARHRSRSLLRAHRAGAAPPPLFPSPMSMTKQRTAQARPPLSVNAPPLRASIISLAFG